MTGSDKHSSLLQYESNYASKKFHDTAPGGTKVEQSTDNPKFESLNPGTSVAPRERENVVRMRSYTILVL